MRKEVFTYESNDGKTNIHAVRWLPEGEVKGVLQIIHGMAEYVERYEEFACFLAEQGFLVTGHDHLGHGSSIVSEQERGYFADTDGGNVLIEDIHSLRKITSAKYPGVMYFMLGHSMGSFLLRRYLTVYWEGVDGALIVGTGTQPEQTLKLGRLMCRFLAKVFNWHHKSRLIDSIAFGKKYHKFEAAGDGTSWLSRNADSVKAYTEDPCCGFLFTLNGFDTLFDTIFYAGRPEHLQRMPKTLPLFILSGKEDPVGDFGTGVKAVYRMYADQGFFDVTWKLYENDRHEILNELDRDCVYKDVLDWINIHRLS